MKKLLLSRANADTASLNKQVLSLSLSGAVFLKKCYEQRFFTEHQTEQ